VKGDARAERQSSSPSALLSPAPSKQKRVAQAAFAAYLLAHLAVQAFRAHGDAARPEPGLEQQPWFVASVLLLLWLPLALLAALELRQGFQSAAPAFQSERARALGFAERLSWVVVVLFTLLHCAQTAWPLLAGSWIAGDVRPELTLSLSSTYRGVPLQASAYLCAVGAGSFCAVRQAMLALSAPPRALARAIVGLGILGYALGSYAVIRCATGPILP
jgi:hypothetical protein